jgi:hypothetical protein
MLRAICMLSDREGHSNAELSNYLGMKPGSVSKLMETMISQKLVCHVWQKRTGRPGRPQEMYLINSNLSVLGKMLGMLDEEILRCDYYLQKMRIKGSTESDYHDLKQERRLYGKARIRLRKTFDLVILYGHLYIRGMDWGDLKAISKGRSRDLLYYINKLERIPFDSRREEMIREALLNGDSTKFPCMKPLEAGSK